MVLILVDMDREDQDINMQIQHHKTLIIENLWGCNNALGKICYKKQNKQNKTKQNKTKNKTNQQKQNKTKQKQKQKRKHPS